MRNCRNSIWRRRWEAALRESTASRLLARQLERRPLANTSMSDIFSHPLLALVKERNLIDDLQLEEVLQEQSRSGKTISQILADFQLVDIDTQLQIMAEHLGTEVVSLNDVELAPETVKAIGSSVARMYQCV